MNSYYHHLRKRTNIPTFTNLVALESPDYRGNALALATHVHMLVWHPKLPLRLPCTSVADFNRRLPTAKRVSHGLDFISRTGHLPNATL